MLPKILVVDDERSIRMLLQAALKEYGYSVDSVASTHEAELKITLVVYRGMIVDFNMPTEDGLSFLRRLKQHAVSLPTIVMSGRDRHDVQQQAKDLPITAFLDKPFELTTLIKVVRETFGAAA